MAGANTKTHHPNGVGFRKMAALWKMAMVDGITLVTDGVLSDLGAAWADEIAITDCDHIGLGPDNLLTVSTINTSGAPPRDTLFSTPTSRKLALTGGSSFKGASLKVTVRCDIDHRTAVGATSWEQMSLAYGSSVLPTSREFRDGNTRNCYLTASVPGPGQIAVVGKVNPPTSQLALTPSAPNGKNGWYSSSPKVALRVSAAPEWMGTSARYRWDSGKDVTYKSPFTAPNGTHVLYYGVRNSYGYVEPLKSAGLKVDASPPTKPTVKTRAAWVRQGRALTVTWISRDPESSILEYTYAVGRTPGGTEVSGWTSVGLSGGMAWIAPSDQLGTYYFSIRAMNKAGTLSSVGTSKPIAVVADGR